MLHCVIDKAGLRWKGFNVPTDSGEDELADGRGEIQKRKMERGWSGKTWPGRTVGPPLTADGGLQFCNISFRTGSYRRT